MQVVAIRKQQLRNVVSLVYLPLDNFTYEPCVFFCLHNIKISCWNVKLSVHDNSIGKYNIPVTSFKKFFFFDIAY